MHVDVPKEQILPLIKEHVVAQMKQAMKKEKKKLEVEDVEWTADGLRLYIKTK